MARKSPLGPLFIDVRGTELTPVEKDKLCHPLVGGVILFSRNYESTAQVSQLISDIKSARTPPLLVAVDQEGGRVQRFRESFIRLPAARLYGELYDRHEQAGLDAAFSGGYLMAMELRATGIDFSFAPVLDVARVESAVIGDRAFHHEPGAVTVLAGAFIKGMGRGGMKAVGKHFPGHGGVEGDSHICLPCDHRKWQDIVDNDILPYRHLCNALQGVMTAHVHYPNIDTELPTYSRHWLIRILREQIGFSGVIFSDDLSMEGAKLGTSPVDRVTAARTAGCDVVMICNDPAAVDTVLDGQGARKERPAGLSLEQMRGQVPDMLAYEQALVMVCEVTQQTD